MDKFFAFLGKSIHRRGGHGCSRSVGERNAPQAASLISSASSATGQALDKVRKREYGRLTAQAQVHQGAEIRCCLTKNLKREEGLKELLVANKRLNTAYILKEEFGQLWDYEREGWARRFFENWRASLKWQRLKPYEKFAAMIDRHWDGIASYCKPENNVALGFVEGLNHKIRVIQRRSYGLRNEEYLRLKVLTCMLPPLKNPEKYPLKTR